MKQKNINIFKNFYQIFGLGKTTINACYFFTGVNTKTCPTNLKRKQQKKIFKRIKLKLLGKPLKKYIQGRIKFYFDIRSWKGLRHYQNYPIRGQRTHTNARTKKKLMSPKFY